MVTDLTWTYPKGPWSQVETSEVSVECPFSESVSGAGAPQTVKAVQHKTNPMIRPWAGGRPLGNG